MSSPNGFIEMRSTAGKLLGEIDPKRLLLRFKIKGNYELVDLSAYGLLSTYQEQKPKTTRSNALFWQ